MSSFLGNLSNIASGNPFATDVGQRIELATDGSLASEDWSANMEVCDIINDTEEGAKDAVRAIRKRLQMNSGKNHTVIMYTLTLLETCVKNCGRKFHILIASKDFCQELVKVIQPKNDPPQVVQEKVLSLIQMWSDAFHGQHDLRGATEVYNELKSKGIEFPMTDLDTLSPIHTPAAVGGETEPDAAARRASATRAQPPAVAVQPTQLQQQHSYRGPVAMGGMPVAVPGAGSEAGGAAGPVGPVALSSEQMTKLRSELDIVAGNTRVFSDMLTQLSAFSVNPDDLQLLQELNRTCREMQNRIVDLINTVNNEEVTEELLRVNDDLNNLLIRYDRFERYRTGRAGQDPDQAKQQQQQAVGAVSGVRLPPPPVAAAAAAAAAVPPPSTSEPSLIQFGDDGGGTGAAAAAAGPGDIHVQLAGLNFGKQNVSSTLNDLPSNISSTGTSTSTYADNTNIDQHSGLASALNKKANPKDKAGDYDEMEQWLGEKGGGAASSDGGVAGGAASGSEGGGRMTSSEFDKFLAERAAVADRLPDVPSDEPQQRDDTTTTAATDQSLFAL